MIPNTPTFERRALNRVTFGATDTDEHYAQLIGWPAWVNEQLAAPPGDDPTLAAFLATQTMPISYAATDNTAGGWPAVSETRPLNYLSAKTSDLWALYAAQNQTVSPTEVFRVRQELAAATWIRNAASKWQLREFMTDFWHNHFNIGKAAHETATVELPVYDRDVIRPNVFGNFRSMLHAVAQSTSMMIYLDNWLSKAALPNENYAREVLELHTLGKDNYLGVVSAVPPSVKAGPYTATAGFTDADVTQASRALSGWTVSNGQYLGAGHVLPMTGEFAYNPTQHNTTAGTFMGVDLSKLPQTDQSQGNAVLDIAAYHPGTAAFVSGKLVRRIFGDTPPQGAYDRALAAWIANVDAPDQIARVLKAILLDGTEVGIWPAQKLRRPYEHLIALFRTTGAVVNAGTGMTSAFDNVVDFLFAWTPPNGRPDSNAYWMTTGAIMTMWNNAMNYQANAAIQTSLRVQTPTYATADATSLIQYWVGRMVGYTLSTDGMNGLFQDQVTTSGIVSMTSNHASATSLENAFRRLVGLIAQSPEFMYR